MSGNNGSSGAGYVSSVRSNREEEQRFLELVKTISFQEAAVGSVFLKDIQTECDGKLVLAKIDRDRFEELASALDMALHRFKKNSYSGLYIHQLLLLMDDLHDSAAQVKRILDIVVGTENEIFTLFIDLRFADVQTLEYFVSLLVKNSSLRELRLVATRVCDVLPRLVEKNSSLICLEVDESDVGGEFDFGLLSEAMKRNQSIERFCLRSKSITDDALSKLAEGLQFSKTINVVKFVGNECADVGLVAFGRLLMFNKVLETCLLKFAVARCCSHESIVCYLQGVGQSQLKDVNYFLVQKNDSILSDVLDSIPGSAQHLRLNNLRLDGSFLHDLCSLAQASNLKDLYLDNCKLGLEAIRAVANLIAKSSKLETLSIKDNALCAKGCQLLAESLRVSQSMASFGFGMWETHQDVTDDFLSILLRECNLMVIDCQENLDVSPTIRDALISGLAQNKSIYQLQIYSVNSVEEFHEALKEALKINQWLCGITITVSNHQKLSIEEFARNQQNVSCYLKVSLLSYLLRQSSESNLTGIADIPNLFRMIWKYSASWLTFQMIGYQNLMEW